MDTGAEREEIDQPTFCGGDKIDDTSQGTVDEGGIDALRGFVLQRSRHQDCP